METGTSILWDNIKGTPYLQFDSEEEVEKTVDILRKNTFLNQISYKILSFRLPEIDEMRYQIGVYSNGTFVGRW